MMEELNKAMKKGGIYKTSYRFLRKDNRYRFFEHEGIVIKNKKKNIFWIIGSIRDITDKVKLQNRTGLAGALVKAKTHREPWAKQNQRVNSL